MPSGWDRCASRGYAWPKTPEQPKFVRTLASRVQRTSLISAAEGHQGPWRLVPVAHAPGSTIIPTVLIVSVFGAPPNDTEPALALAIVIL